MTHPPVTVRYFAGAIALAELALSVAVFALFFFLGLVVIFFVAEEKR